MIIFKEFSEPDERWALSGINSYEEYIKSFVISGKFHKDVPKDVIKEYKAVEYIMASSFYYYPLYEEAFSKLSRIFEMTIKLLYNESFKQEYKNEPRTLKEYLCRIGKQLDAELHKEWDKAREIRNFYAHPKNHSFGSPFQLRDACVQLINVINKLFKPTGYQKSLNNNLEHLRIKHKQFDNGLFKYNYQGRPILLHGAVPYCFLKERNVSLWMFHPVLIDFPQSAEDKINFSLPIFIQLKDIEVVGDTLRGTDLENEEQIELIKSDNEEDLRSKENFDKMTKSASDEVIEMYTNILFNKMGVQTVNFEYKYYWNE